MQALKPAPCSTGSWAQKFECGWHQPTTTAAHVGYTTGHDVMPIVIGLLIVAVLIALARRSRSSAPATTSK
jgi:hypothetical protein